MLVRNSTRARLARTALAASTLGALGVTTACSKGADDGASGSDQGLSDGSTVAVACEVHYFDSATGTKIFNAAAGKANVSSLAQTPLVMTTSDGITANVNSFAASTITVDVEQTSKLLGSAAYFVSSDPRFSTDLQLSMLAPVVKAGVTYDSVWVGCFPAAMVPPPPTGNRREDQARSIESFVDALAPFTAWHEAVDAEAVKTRQRAAIMQGDGSDGVFFTAAWHALNAFPQGHQALVSPDPAVCGKALAWMDTSRFGVCGRASATGLVVTSAAAGNKLGLAVGDVVVDAGGDTNEALYANAYDRPMCGDVFPAASGRRAAGAATFFGSVPPGMKLSVVALSGAKREVVVPAEGDAQPTDCTDPFGRSRQIFAEAKRRPDGVAVIRLPSFYPFDKALPSTATQADSDAFTAAYQAEIQKVFDSVKDAPAIIWDARGNTGGITPVALAIVSGFSTATATPVSYCQTRVSSSSPPAFDGPRYAEYAITPGGPFAYAGKVAIVTDGLAYSAGDYFPFAAVKGAKALVVGSSTAGAYGGGHGNIDIAGPPALTANYDPTGCFDAATNKPLEAAPLPPTVSVELDPADVAASKDTVIERAVKELGF